MNYLDSRPENILPKRPRMSFEYLHSKVVAEAERPIHTEHDLERFLVSWWCKTYGRPRKDPVLQSYVLEELLREYLDVIYRSDPDGYKKIKAAEKHSKEDDVWAAKMAKELGTEIVPDQRDAAEDFIEVAEGGGETATMGGQSVSFDLPDDLP